MVLIWMQSQERRRHPSKAQNISCMQQDTSGTMIDRGRLPDRPLVHDSAISVHFQFRAMSVISPAGCFGHPFSMLPINRLPRSGLKHGSSLFRGLRWTGP